MSDQPKSDLGNYTHLLLKFLGDSSTPFHAVQNMESILDEAGFKRLEETQDWNIEPFGKYYVTRNGSSIIAFSGGRNSPNSSGVRIIGAHTDSPCLKLNPHPFIQSHGYGSLNVEIYGSALVRTWFDRDLSVAGRVYYRDQAGVTRNCLIDLKRPVAVVPSIAIHLERNANRKQRIDLQRQLNPVFSVDGESGSTSTALLGLIGQQLADIDVSRGFKAVTGFDLSLYDVNPPALVGLGNEFVSSARIDNLLSCYAGVRALVGSSFENFNILVCNDHEEVGSCSDSGAQGSFLRSVLERTAGLDARVIRQSMLISADGAHGIHPNYPDKHDEAHAPVLNRGPVVKMNTNQRYATTGESFSLIRNLGEKLEIPIQDFVSRNNIPCGTTIGPITAAALGIKTVDIGVAQFAMHSIRELAGARDAFDFYRLLCAFLDSDIPDS